jgi:hypothetical protein
MKYAIVCGGCRRKYRIPEAYIGKNVKCPQCETRTRITRELLVEEADLPLPPNAPRPIQPLQARPHGTPPAAKGLATPDVSRPSVRVSNTERIPPSASQSQLPNTDAAGEPYPWLPAADELAKAQDYYQRRQVQVYACRCGEFLNSVVKTDVLRKDLFPLQLEVYPEFVGVDAREVSPGGLASLLAALPPWVRTMLGLAIAVMTLVLDLVAETGCLGVLFAPFLIVPILILVVLSSLAMIPLAAILSLANSLFDQWYRKYIDEAARRVRANPGSQYSIRQLHKRGLLAPRVWERGDIQQVVFVETRRRLRNLSCLLFVQDSPLPAIAGADGFAPYVWICRIFTARRRIYLTRLEYADEAERAGQLAAQALDVPLSRGRFTWYGYSLQ